MNGFVNLIMGMDIVQRFQSFKIVVGQASASFPAVFQDHLLGQERGSVSRETEGKKRNGSERGNVCFIGFMDRHPSLGKSTPKATPLCIKVRFAICK